jgi:hypothetical protein
MKKEFIVSKIDTSQDDSPYVYVVLTDTRASIPITSLDDLKNLPKKISDALEGAFGGNRNNVSPESTTFKMNTREYEKLGIKIGDRITIEIKLSTDDIGA